MAKTTPIGIRADREYVDTLNSLASTLGTTTSDLVRTAVDQKYGAQLEVVRLHNAKLGQKIIHSVNQEATDVAV